MSVRSVSLIFLAIDGVLINRFDERVSGRIALEMENLYQEGLGLGYSESLVYKRAVARCFSLVATASLKNMIDRVQQAAKTAMHSHPEESVGIVISSSWREDGDLDTLKNYVFADVFFRDLMIDKTPDSDLSRQLALREKSELEISSMLQDLSKEKYGFSLDNDKGRSIDFWLRENYQNLKTREGEKMELKSILILDDDPFTEIWARFPKHSIQVGATLFSQEDADVGYKILSDIPFSSDDFVTEEGVKKFLEEREIYRREQCVVS